MNPLGAGSALHPRQSCCASTAFAGRDKPENVDAAVRARRGCRDQTERDPEALALAQKLAQTLSVNGFALGHFAKPIVGRG